MAPDAGFDQWWLIYPRKDRKVLAKQAWQRIALTSEDVEVLVAGARAYRRATAGEDPKYLTSPDRWLLDSRWTDEHHGPRLTTEERLTQHGPGIYYPADL